jgi:hypothetical protein
MSPFSTGRSAFLRASASALRPAPPTRSPSSFVPHPRRDDLDALIQALLDAKIDFIVVGGAAAVLIAVKSATGRARDKLESRSS